MRFHRLSALAPLLLAACGGGYTNGYAVGLTIEFDPMVSLSSVSSLDLAISGAEMYDKKLTNLSLNSFQQSVVYKPLVPSGTLLFTGTAFDAKGNELETGMVNVALAPGTTVLSPLFLSGVHAPDAAGHPDLTLPSDAAPSPDLSGQDLATQDLVAGPDFVMPVDMANSTCANKVKDGNETDIDCGGSCAPCALGKVCKLGGDCASTACALTQTGSLACAAMPCAPCTVVNSMGACVNATAGSNPGALCVADGKCKLASCNGAGGCALQMPGFACGPASCAAATLMSSTCDAMGACNTTTSSCGFFVCASATACKTSCTLASDCAPSAKCIGGACQPSAFAGAVNVPMAPTCTSPQSLTINDFNLDGAPDIAVVCSNDLDLMTNKGDGVSWAVVHQATLMSPSRTIAAADFNLDGRTDVVVASQGSSSMLPLLATAGGFTVMSALPTGPSPLGIAALDVNRDGRIDIAIASSTAKTVQSFIDNSAIAGATLTFSSSTTNTLPGLGTSAMTTADINRDGFTDLIAASPGDGTINVYYGNSTGTFSIGQTLKGSAPEGVIVLDLNLDGLLDIVAADATASSLLIFTGTSSGMFANAPTISAPTTPFSVAAADFNGDGRIDLASVGHGSANVSVFLASGTNTFAAAQVFTVAAGPNNLQVADLNNDGRPDLAVTCDSGNVVSILLNAYPSLPAAAFVAKTFPLPAGSKGPVNLALADVPLGASNGDGNLDVIAVDQDSNDLMILLGTASMSLAAGQRAPVTTVSSPQQILFADFARVGGFSVAILDNGMKEIAVDGNGEKLTPDFNPATSFAMADINLDGIRDLVVGSTGSGAYTLMIGRGDGTFNPSVQPITGLTSATAVALGDLNRDGKPDLVAVSQGNVSVQAGTGNIFGAPKITAAGKLFAHVLLGDFNNDGRLDVAASDQVTNAVTLFLGDGNLGFLSMKTFPVGVMPAGLASGDFNRDGKLDLAVANQGAGTVSVLLGDGLGGFGTTLTPPVGNGPQAVAVGDLDKDGRPDIAVVNYMDSSVTVLFNQSK